MKSGLYLKLSVNGIKKNKKLYLPYLITCICMVMMFYLIDYLAVSPQFAKIKGGDTMQMILGFGSGVISIFSLILLYYTNSFLIRRRQKEFGWTDPCLWSNANGVKGTVSVSHCL